MRTKASVVNLQEKTGVWDGSRPWTIGCWYNLSSPYTVML